MQVMAKFEGAGVRVTEIAIDMQIILEDQIVDAEEFPLLVAAVLELMEQGLVIEDAGYDVLSAIQTLRLGRHEVPDRRHLEPKILDFERRKAELEQLKAAKRCERRAA